MTATLVRSASADGKIVVEYDDDAHAYYLRAPDLGRIPSVTGILGIFDKPALKGWAASETIKGVATLHRRGCKGAREDHATFSDPRRLGAKLSEERLTFRHTTSNAAERGTAVHKAVEAWVQEGRIPLARDFAPSTRNYVLAFGAWLQAHEPRFESSEVIVASAQYRYAGTYDARVAVTKRCGVKSCGCARIDLGAVGRIDYKTSKRVYPFEHFAQLDGYEVAAREMGEPLAPWRGVLRLGADGAFEFVVSPVAFGVFVPLLEAYQVKRRIEATCKGGRNVRQG